MIKKVKARKSKKQNCFLLRKWMMVVGLILVFAVVAGLVAYVCFRQLNEQKDDLNSVNNNIQQEKTENEQTVVKGTKTKSEGIYFGKGWEMNYSLVDVNTEEEIPFIPEGYSIVSQQSYNQFPTYLILKKNNDYYSYNIETKLLVNIFDKHKEFKPKDGQFAYITSSITEKDKSLVTVYSVDLNSENDGMGESPLIDPRYYTFDASKNELSQINFVGTNNCEEYDSKNQRVFGWLCGEGVGNSAPLSIYDLNGKKLSDVITTEEFGLSNDSYMVSVQYANGLFFAHDKSTIAKVITLDPQFVIPKKEIYLADEKVSSQVTDAYPYSNNISKENNTIIIGGGNFILLLRYNDKNQIVETKYLQDKAIYANFTFVNEGKLYYQASNYIQVINLSNWEREKSIPSPRHVEITLIKLPK